MREVRDILGLIDDYKLQTLIKGLALQIGNLIEYKELARLSEFSYPALKKYLNFLEKTYIAHLVRPFFQNKRTEVVKNPKVFFFDTGLRNTALNDYRPLKDRPDSGALLENALALQFIKAHVEFRYWRDKQKHEIDFILDLGNGRHMALESKTFLKRNHISGIPSFQRNYPQIPLYWSYCNKEINLDTPNALPLYLF